MNLKKTYTLALLVVASVATGLNCLAETGITVQDLIVLDARGNPGAGYIAQSAVDIEELVVLSGEDATTDEMFGPDVGNIHAFITVRGEYTDNVYNINNEDLTRSNFLTSISPNVWVITPKADRIPVQLSSYNTAVGGTRFSMPRVGSFDRFQAYLLGGLDYKLYSADSELDYTSWNLEGMFQYNLPAGLSFRIMDKLVIDRDRIEVGSFDSSTHDVVEDEVIVGVNAHFRDFISNQAVGFLNFEMTDRFAALLTYTNFYLDMDDPRDDWLDRMDNLLNLDLKYNHSPKTSLFVQGKYTTTEYDTATYNDSDNLFFYGGINWHKSIKTQLMFKAGYQIKNLKNRDELDNTNNSDHIDTGQDEDVESFVGETWLNYRYSDKTKFSFKLAKEVEETDTALSIGKDTISSRFYIDYEFTERLRCYFTARLELYDYEGYYLNVEQRDEFLWGATPALQYDFRKWLMAELSYTYEKRDSNIEIYDFTTQTAYLSINASF